MSVSQRSTDTMSLSSPQGEENIVENCFRTTLAKLEGIQALRCLGRDGAHVRKRHTQPVAVPACPGGIDFIYHPRLPSHPLSFLPVFLTGGAETGVYEHNRTRPRAGPRLRAPGTFSSRREAGGA